MPRFEALLIRQLAIRVLEDAEREAKIKPGRSWGTRLAIVVLANGLENRGPFDWFWASLATENDIGRTQNVSAALNAICRECGLGRTR